MSVLTTYYMLASPHTTNVGDTLYYRNSFCASKAEAKALGSTMTSPYRLISIGFPDDVVQRIGSGEGRKERLELMNRARRVYGLPV